MSNRRHDRDQQDHGYHSDYRGPAVSPGKRTVTAGLVMRKAERDANGVSAGAESAVDRAGGSSGFALPDGLRGQFESSLGADLSGVRVHTGSESAEASRAVGAKAYTTGQDIHFGAGHYDVSSAFGVHLLAHEVAHTVQQQGSAPTRQNKLEVSSPQDGAEHEADRAADAMVAGQTASVSLGGLGALHRDQEFPDAIDVSAVAPSTEMRERGEEAVQQRRQVPAMKSAGPTTAVDVRCAESTINHIESQTGTFGMLQGREAAANKEGQEDAGFQEIFVPYNEAGACLAHNGQVVEKLHSFSKSASRQSFQHTFFAESYAQLSEDVIRLQATVNVIKQQQLTLTGEGARNDVQEARDNDPELASALDMLQGAITDLQNTSSNAGSGVAALAKDAGAAFDELGNDTDAMKLPPPQFKETKDQEIAQREVSLINADLAAAKATIGTIKSVVTAAFSLATAGTGAEGMKPISEFLGSMGDKAASIAKKVDGTGVLKSDGAKAATGAATGAASGAVEDSLATWMTSYSTRISAANGRVDALENQVHGQYKRLQLDKVHNTQAKLAAAIGKLAQLKQQIEEKKAAVTECAKKVQERASMNGTPTNGTDVGAAAQAMGTVSTFLVQADATQALGRQEMQYGLLAQSAREEVAGEYRLGRIENDLGTGNATLAQTMGNDGGSFYWAVTRRADADRRDTFDMSGYEIEKYGITFVVTEDDASDRSIVMKTRTEDQLKNVDVYKTDALKMQAELAETLGSGPTKIK